MKFCTAEEMRLLDHKAINECGLPGIVLMENAGRGAAHALADAYGDLTGRRVAVVAGKGNNGGDGFVIGRILHGWGAVVRCFLLGAKSDVTGDAKTNLDAALNLGLEVIEIAEDRHMERLDLSGAEVIVDAIFGTGLSSEVRGRYGAAIEAVNRQSAFVLAVDIPSGLCADTGRPLGVAVQADLTAAFGLAKTGLLQPPGEDLVGRLAIVDIGIPRHVLAEADPGKVFIDQAEARILVPPQKPDDHKGVNGRVLILAGSTGKTGAAALTALGAGRAGAGLITAAVPASLNPVLEVKLTEAMTICLPEDPPGAVSADALDLILEQAAGREVLALGPGLGVGDGAKQLVKDLVAQCDLPLVIDADGLNILAESPGVLKKARREAVLTPHPGEMARLTGLSVKEVLDDRLQVARDFSAEYQVVLVLKGHRTIVASPDGRLSMNGSGGPYMASGGMGDVLTGVVAGLIARRMNPADAARLAVYAHGLAGDLAAADLGPTGILASDLLDRLPAVWARLSRPPSPLKRGEGERGKQR